jgi:glycosyltransferase involved in cell wall biosynthesis
MTVSVVIPAYNAGSFIDDAISSVLAQDVAVDEIIVVDDGSIDRDYAELKRFHGSIKVVRQPNRGVSAARNLGCNVATSTYIAILDADDVWLTGKLRTQIRHLSMNPSVDAVFCRGLVWMPLPDGTTWVPPAFPPNDDALEHKVIHLNYPDFLCSVPVAPSTMVIKRSVWRELGGFNESMRYGEDFDFYLRLSFCCKVDLIDIVGMLYRRHPNSATAAVQETNHWANVINRAVETLGTIDRYGNRVDPYKLARYLSFIHFQYGYGHFLASNFRAARREFWLSVKKAPRNYRAFAYLTVSSAPGLRAFARWLRRQLAEQEEGAFRGNRHLPVESDPTKVEGTGALGQRSTKKSRPSQD